jgi:hypothetical protein
VSAKSAGALGFGLGVLIAAPLAAPIGCWLFERWLVRNECLPVRANAARVAGED